MTEYYRAEVTLSRVTEGSGSQTFAEINLTADSAAEVMEQIKLHVNMLRDWHRQPTVTGYNFGGLVRMEDAQ